MTFYNYMMRYYRKADGPKGNLAQDMHEDWKNFPRNGTGKYNGWYRILRDYMEKCGVCDDCMRVFRECWAEYVAYDRQKRCLSDNHRPFIWEDGE